MLLFDANMGSPYLTDCELFKDNTVRPDAQQDWVHTANDLGSRYQKHFTSRRGLESPDENDFAFQIDRELLFGYQLIKDVEPGLGDSGYEPQETWNYDSILLLSDG